MALDAHALARSAWGYERELGGALAEAARTRFGIGVVGKAHDGGRVSLRREQCAACGAEFLVYAGVREPASDWFQLTLQGIAEMGSERPAV